MIKFQVWDKDFDEAVGPEFDSFTDAYHRWQFEARNTSPDALTIIDVQYEDGPKQLTTLGAVLADDDGKIITHQGPFTSEDRRTRWIDEHNRALDKAPHPFPYRWRPSSVTVAPPAMKVVPAAVPLVEVGLAS